jgi:hypothetical protein
LVRRIVVLWAVGCTVKAPKPSVPGQELLAEQSGLLFEVIVFSRQADACVDAVGGPAAGGCDGEVRQEDDMQYG